jgi:hypothetical protein
MRVNAIHVASQGSDVTRRRGRFSKPSISSWLRLPRALSLSDKDLTLSEEMRDREVVMRPAQHSDEDARASAPVPHLEPLPLPGPLRVRSPGVMTVRLPVVVG